MSAPKKVIRCHYEVLEVERTATSEEIRASYKQLARKCHPDKNLDDPTGAAERFKEVQQAYEVLSDANERSWYDSHRDAILRGVDPSEAGGSVDLINVWPYFSANCYSGFGDEKPGFYGVYGEVFSEINKKEQELGESPQEWPVFGNSATPWEDVALFYRHWSNYVTALSFGWSEKYHVTSQINRRVRRLMDKENKKDRGGAKKEFIDSIRKLVDFVKKRDPRVIEHNKIEEQKQAEKLQKQKELKMKQQQERREHIERLLKEREEEEDDEESLTDEDTLSGEDAADSGEDDAANENNTNEEKTNDNGDEVQDDNVEPEEEADEDLDELYCYACRKRFKSDKQKLNHEQSKKHKDTVAKMRKEVMLDDEEANDSERVSSSEVVANRGNNKNNKDKKGNKADNKKPNQASKQDTAKQVTPAPVPVEEKSKVTAPKKDAHVAPVAKKSDSENDSDEDEDENEDDYVLRSMMQRVQVSSNKKNKKQQQQARMLREMGAEFDKVNEVIDAHVKSPQDSSEEDEDQVAVGPVEEQSKDEPKEVVEDKTETGAKKKKRRRAVKDKTGATTNTSANASPSVSSNNNVQAPVAVMTKKEAKKEAKSAATEDDEFTCKVCSEQFLTRNALFTHIKKTKHAAIKQ